jgi:hypothetical protein
LRFRPEASRSREWVENPEGPISRPFPYVKNKVIFVYNFLSLIKTKSNKMRKTMQICKRYSTEFENCQIRCTGPSTFQKVQFLITSKFKPGRVLKIQREKSSWSLGVLKAPTICNARK